MRDIAAFLTDISVARIRAPAQPVEEVTGDRDDDCLACGDPQALLAELPVRDSGIPHEVRIEAVAPVRAGSDPVGFDGGASCFGSSGEGALHVTGLSVLAIVLPNP